MSIESAKDFYDRLATDEAFRIQLLNAANEERTAIIQAAGYDFTPEEWESATAEILAVAEANPELDEAELEAIAGGVFPTIVTIYGSPLPPNLRWPS